MSCGSRSYEGSVAPCQRGDRQSRSNFGRDAGQAFAGRNVDQIGRHTGAASKCIGQCRPSSRIVRLGAARPNSPPERFDQAEPITAASVSSSSRRTARGSRGEQGRRVSASRTTVLRDGAHVWRPPRGWRIVAKTLGTPGPQCSSNSRFSPRTIARKTSPPQLVVF
jgi:hypothetical protein